MIIDYLKKIKPLTVATHIFVLIEGDSLEQATKKITGLLTPAGFGAKEVEKCLALQFAHNSSPEKKKSVSFPIELGKIVHSVTIQLLAQAKQEGVNEVVRSYASQAVKSARQREMLVIVESQLNAVLGYFLEGAELGAFDLQRYKAKPKTKLLQQLHILLDATTNVADLNKYLIAARATNGARELVDTPAELCNSLHIVERAKEIAKASKLQIEILDAKALKKLGANGLLTVNKASGNPTFLIKLTNKPAGKSAKKLAKKIAFVGKGVTFDTGGLCIKSAAGMEAMKKDMAGAAAVMYAMSALGQLGSDAEITAYLPIVENSINELSMRPGDIYQSLSGKYIEVINTDAEGRLILIDALTLAEREGAEIIVDLATLTGACSAALGDMFAGIFSRDATLTKQLIVASKLSGDGLWPLPFHAEYAKAVESRLADFRNSATYGPGASTAAHFLEAAFSKKDICWAHIDMSGPASMTRDVGYKVKGATGFGVRLLIEFVGGLSTVIPS